MALQQWRRDTYDRSASLRFLIGMARTIKHSLSARRVRPPFAGDTYLAEAMDFLLTSVPVRQLVETGTCLGDTSRHLAARHPELQITTIESHPVFFRASRTVLLAFPKVAQIGIDPATALRHLLISEQLEGTPLFFLDLHRGNPLPVKEEIRMIGTHLESAILLIRGFRVPDRDHFRYDEYDGEEVGIDLLRESMVPERTYQVLVPTYGPREVFGDAPRDSSSALRGYAIVFQGSPDAYREFTRSPLGSRYAPAPL